jgi:hypothetical protein
LFGGYVAPGCVAFREHETVKSTVEDESAGALANEGILETLLVWDPSGSDPGPGWAEENWVDHTFMTGYTGEHRFYLKI